jgi:hypothetical protein
MAKDLTLLALFQDIDPAADGIDKLRELGLSDDQMNVISGIPVTEEMLGRPDVWTNVPRLAIGGALAGFAIGLFFTVGTKFLYPISVGGQPFISIPPSIVIIFELTMLGMLASTFLGVFLDSYFPSYAPKEYVPEISDGKIGILFHCPSDKQNEVTNELTSVGAEEVKPAEAHQL